MTIYIHDSSAIGRPPSFLPAYLDPTELIDVTCVGAKFRVYVDPRTGERHDGAEYHRQFMIGLEAERT